MSLHNKYLELEYIKTWKWSAQNYLTFKIIYMHTSEAVSNDMAESSQSIISSLISFVDDDKLF